MKREFEIAALRRQDQYERDTTVAWMVAALSRQDKLPPLKTLLMKHEVTKLTPAAQKTSVALLGEFTGTGMRPISPEAAQALQRLGRSARE